MPNFRKFLVIFFVLSLLLGVIASQIHFFIGGYVANQSITEGDYLESLRNNTEFGCMTVLAREPELLLVGNSGSYATWDMRQLERLTGLKVGGCMMGGATIETFELILDLAKYAYQPPKHIIIGSSIYTFLKPESYSEQLSLQKNLLRKAQFPYKYLIDMAQKKVRHVYSYPLSLKEQESAKLFHENKLKVSDAFIESTILSRHIPDINNAKKLNAAERFDDFGSGSVTNICAKIKSMGAKLWVINIPTSPEAEAVYTNDLWAYYQTALHGFDQCAVKTIPFRSSHYGLKNRDYVNRMLDKNPYDQWKSGESFELYYDVDHPNPFGAAKFTKLAVPLLFGDGRFINLNLEHLVNQSLK